MIKRLKQRLTYSHVIQLVGLVVALGMGYLWFSKTPFQIFGIRVEDQHEQFTYIVTILGGITILVLPIVFPRFAGDQLVFISDTELPTSEDVRLKNRLDMLKLVEEIWITGFLNNVLNQMAALKLDMHFAEPEKILHRPGLQDYKLPTTAAIHSIYVELNRRLVILGEPGAGKTVLLLQLARELIVEARNDERRPIPVIFALSSWAATQLPFEKWLKQELCYRYGLSRPLANDLVEGEQLLYLFDGLDEVAENRRESCLVALKKFVQEYPVEYVLSCRKAEFFMLTTRLNIPGEIVIQPLKSNQIIDYLQGDEFSSLRSLFLNNPIIRDDFARIPFMLNTMAVVTRGLQERTIRLELIDDTDRIALRNYFLEHYMNRRLHEQPNIHYQNLSQVRRYFRWLASELIQHDQTDFYVENLQSSWIGSDVARDNYRWTVRLVFGLLGGVLFGLVFGLLGGVLLGGLLFGLLFGFGDDIKLVDYLDWSFSRSILGVRLLFGLLIGFEGRITDDKKLADYLDWSFSRSILGVGLLFGLGGRLGSGLGVALGYALGIGLLFGLKPRTSVLLRLRPNDGIRRSLVNYCRFALLFGFGVGLLGGPLVGLLGGLLGGLSNGGEAVIKHILLRSYLVAEGGLPYWRYDRFLNYGADLVILRRVGGGYRFVHDDLRQYLARATFVPLSKFTASNN